MATATYYRVQVNTKSDFSGDMLWDSGKVAFDSPVNEDAWSEDIPYGGSELEAETKYWWRIKLWDSDGIELPWSDGEDPERGYIEEEEADFTMGVEAPLISLIG